MKWLKFRVPYVPGTPRSTPMTSLSLYTLRQVLPGIPISVTRKCRLEDPLLLSGGGGVQTPILCYSSTCAINCSFFNYVCDSTHPLIPLGPTIYLIPPPSHYCLPAQIVISRLAQFPCPTSVIIPLLLCHFVRCSWLSPTLVRGNSLPFPSLHLYS